MPKNSFQIAMEMVENFFLSKEMTDQKTDKGNFKAPSHSLKTLLDIHNDYKYQTKPANTPIKASDFFPKEFSMDRPS